MSKKSKTTSTMTPIVPDWITSPVQSALGRIGQIGQMDPYKLVAPSNHLLDKSFGLAGELGGEFQKNLWDQAIGATGSLRSFMSASAPTASATSGLDYIDDWLNRYTDDVIDTTLGRFDEDARAASAAETLRMAGSGAFGGSGAALAAAAMERERTLNRGELEANMRHQGWESAAGHAGQDADRFAEVSVANAQLEAQTQALQLQALQAMAQGYAGLAAGYGQDQRETIGLLGDLGGYMRGMEQERLLAPITLAQAEAGLLGQLPLNMWQGQHTTGTTKTSDPLGAIMDIAKLVSMPFFPGGTSLLGAVLPTPAAIPSLGGFQNGLLGDQPLYDTTSFLRAMGPYVR